MPRDINGTYTLPTNDSSPAAPRNVIRSSDFNELTGDYATALTDSLSRSGDGAMLANLDFGGFAAENATNIPALAANTMPVDNAGGTARETKTFPQVRNILDVPVYAATRTALKALDTTNDILAYLKEDGREGIFEWTSGDFSTLITADTLEGVYIKADAIASTAGAWVRQYDGGVFVEWFGAVLDGVTDCTAAINAAITLQGVLGGGEVLLGPGTAILSNSNSGAASWDNYRAIYVGSDNIHIRGAGRGATILQLANSANCHVIKFGSRITSTVTVSDCSVSGIEINGNRANQTTPTDPTDHWQGIDISSGCSRIHIHDFYIHDVQYYGIGGQRTNLRYCTIENGVIENSGADSIDWKNDDGDGRGNVIRDITAINPGLATGLSLAEAAFDFRSGVYFENLTAHTLTAEADLVGLRIQVDGNSTESTLPTYPTTGRGVTVIGNDGATSYGVRVAVRNTMIEGIFARDFNQGIRISAPDVKICNFDVHSNAYGIFLTAGTAVEADTCQLVNGTVRDNTTAGIVYDSVDEITATNVDVRGNGIGHDIRAGSTSVRILGGSASGNTTNVSDSGTGTIIHDVSGYKTRSSASVSVAIDSTGIKSIAIPHGLPFTPNHTDYVLMLRRNTNVGDWVAGFLWTTSADATNVNGQLRVTTASATGGAVVDVVAHVHGKTFT